ncbi:MAG: hypothetical protein R3E44_12840 [Paracoccaceae bacterium]
MTRPLLAVCLILAPTAALAEIAYPQTVDDTLQVMQDHARALDGVVTADIDWAEKSLKVVVRDGDGTQEMTSYPDNLHLILQQAASGDARQEAVDRYLAAIVGPDGQAAAAKMTFDLDAVLPKLNAKDYAAQIKHTGDGPALVATEFMGDAEITYVLDTPTSMSYINTGDMDAAGIDAPTLQRRAFENMVARLPEVEVIAIEDTGISMVSLDGNYEATLLALPEFWERQVEDSARIVAIVPNRDLLVYALDPADETLASLLEICAEYFGEGAYSLSEYSYERADGTWRVGPKCE